MFYFILISSLFLGLIVGSFLNVVALRFNTGKSLGGRSGCFSCGNQLSWYELFPAFSWIIQKGRCRKCSSRISPTYILGELTTGIFFGLVAVRGFLVGMNFDQIFNTAYLGATLFLWILFSILMVILFYDIRHKIIPNELSFIFGLLSFGSLFFFGFSADVYTFIGFNIPTLSFFLGGIVVPLPFILLWIISKGRWIGLGDPKLMVGMGFLFGVSQGFSSVFLSFWIGALFAFCIAIINFIFKKRLLRSAKASIMKEEMPFAPFLILATLIIIISNLNFFTIV